MSYLKSLGTGFIWICTFLAAITFIPGLPPQLETTPYSVKQPVALTKDRNGKLNNAEKLFDGEIHGPEAFDVYDGVLYMSLHGGSVSKLVGDKLVEVVKFGKKCDGLWEEEKCGRPLGLKFDKMGNLYVVDAYYGIFKVNINTKKYEKIIDITKPIAGKIPMIPNSIDVASNGDLYWTVSDSQFKLNDIVYSFLANPSGRLIRYNAATKKNEVLLKDLGFANGVKLSDDESFVLVVETMMSRVIKYNLKGPKAGKSEVFMEALPGLPDNIDSDGQGNFFLPMVMIADEEHPILSQSLAPHSNLRKMLLRLIGIVEAPFKLLEEAYPNFYTKLIVSRIGHGESLGALSTPGARILRVDKNGKILDIIENNDDKISGICHATILDNYLYLGSPFNRYIARVPLDKALPGFKQEKIVVKKVEKQQAKPTVATTTTTTTTTTTPRPTQKPVTTTPKPTATPEPVKKVPEPVKKIPEPVKKNPEPVKKVSEQVKKTPEPEKASKPVVEKVKEQAKAKVEAIKKPVPTKDTQQKQPDIKPVREVPETQKTQYQQPPRDEM